jgi:6-phosphogluconolactonase
MGKLRGELRVFESTEALAQACAGWLCERALAAPGRFAIALAGGSTPGPVYAQLARAPLAQHFPWTRVHWFWGDERLVPHDHPDSNQRLVRETLLDHVPVPAQNVHPIPTAGLGPEQAAHAYEAELRRFHGSGELSAAEPLFDVALLGVGEDGHTASLLPGQPVLDERTRWVAAVPHGRPEPRITLTYPALEASRCLAFLATGAGKREVIARVRQADRALPAGRLAPHGTVLWFLDRAAAPADAQAQ